MSNKNNTNDNRDLCSRNVKAKGLKVHDTVSKAKQIIDNVFDPLTGGTSNSNTYTNAGYRFSRDDYTYETTYEIINLDPNNPYDIYYRDDDLEIWNKNRKSDNFEIRKNIQSIHDKIVVPIRTRVINTFGDNANVKIDLCFLSKEALIKYKLPQDHIMSKGKAVLLLIEGTRASMVYDDVMSWVKDEDQLEDPNDELLNETKPEYGLMKLCNTENEKQRIYITLPFTNEELKNDELLLHNYSNFYYTEANDFKMLPDSSTSTKIFPAYVPDNNVEDLYNKVDDLEQELKKIDDLIQMSKEDKGFAKTEDLIAQKIKIESEINNLNNPKLNISEIDNRIEVLESINKRIDSDIYKRELEALKKEKKSYPNIKTIKDAQEAIKLLTQLEFSLTSEFNISNEDKNYNIISDFFKFKKMLYLRGVINVLDNIQPILNEEYIKTELDFRKQLYQAEWQKQYDEIYKRKEQEALDKTAYIEVNESEIDMSNFVKPTRDLIIQEILNKYKNDKQKLIDIYNNMALDDLEFIEYSIYNINEYYKNKSDLELIEIELEEIAKFPFLKEINNIILLKKDKILNQKPNIDLINFIKNTNSINKNFLLLTNDKTDFDEVSEYYYNEMKSINNGFENIDEKILLSKTLNNILNRDKLNSVLLPPNNTKEYANFVINYLTCEIEAYRILNNPNKVDELTIKLEEYKKFLETEDYSKIDLDNIKSSIFQFTDAEYITFQNKKMKDDYSNINIDINDRSSIYLSYLVKDIFIGRSALSWYTTLNDEIGRLSINYQLIKDELIDLISEDNINELELNIPNSIKANINEINSFIKDNIVRLNNYIDYHNNYIIPLNYINKNKYNLDEKATLDNIERNNININLIKIYKSFEVVFNNLDLLDYGHEYILLNEQIQNMKYLDKQSSDNSYNILLKNDRLIWKRTYKYLRMTDTEKKLDNYSREYDIALKSNRISRANEIKCNIIPEINRLINLKENYTKIDEETKEYEIYKANETERLKFISEINNDNTWDLYKYVTNNTTLDFKYKQGKFKNLELNKNQKYLIYLNDLINDLKNANNRSLDPEVDALKYEMAYIKNENNEKKIRKDEIKRNLTNKKIDIENEINKRVNDKLYNHFITIKNELESSLKYKYKSYIKIENLPSKGINYIYPFYLFDKFKKLYLEEIKKIFNYDPNLDKIEIFEYLDAYREYCKNYYIYQYNFYKKSIEIHKKWKKINYNLFINPELKDKYIESLTDNPNSYKIIILTNENYDLEEFIVFSLKNIVGFMDFELLPKKSVYNNDNISTVLKVRLRRTSNFLDDINLFLKNLYEVEENIIKNYIIIENY